MGSTQRDEGKPEMTKIFTLHFLECSASSEGPQRRPYVKTFCSSKEKRSNSNELSSYSWLEYMFGSSGK